MGRGSSMSGKGKVPKGIKVSVKEYRAGQFGIIFIKIMKKLYGRQMVKD